MEYEKLTIDKEKNYSEILVDFINSCLIYEES